jgi:hypothetical protein
VRKPNQTQVKTVPGHFKAMGGNSTLTTDGVCYDILAEHPVTIAGRQVGAVIVSIAIIYLIGSFYALHSFNCV